MKLDIWEAISSLLEAGGKFEHGRYIVLNSNGEPHREDGPAIIYPYGTLKWYRNGEFHREDGPAIIYPDGAQEWYRNGQLHRDDGPAAIYPDGKLSWYTNGLPRPSRKIPSK
jgi:hypothetical protein